jgi:ribonuclease P protein component
VVQRNKLRRRLRELLRKVLLSRAVPLDYLVRIRPSAYERSFVELENQLRVLEGRIPDSKREEQ